MATVKVTDECLWFKHVDDPLIRIAFASLHAGSKIDLLINGELIVFERMSMASTGLQTMGLKPVGETQHIWRNYYLSRKGTTLSLEFAGKYNG